MVVLIAIILGIVEGFTEFLPISSTGHLIVAEKILNFQDMNDIFTVVVQLGAIAAVIWFYRKDLFDKTKGLIQRRADAINFWKLLVIATIPAGIVGLILGSNMEKLTTPGVVAGALIIGGVILWLVDRAPVVSSGLVGSPVIGKISTKQALLVGIGQCIAIIPGVSRSGATIVTGLATGMDRPTATAFSFYLSIPVLVLASGYKLAKHGDALSSIPGGSLSLVIGLVSAFITALIAVSWLLKYIAHHNFKPFAYYRIAAGLLILALLATNVI